MVCLASSHFIPDADSRNTRGRRTFTHMAGIGWTRPMTPRGRRRHARRRGRRVRGRSRGRRRRERGIVPGVVRSVRLVNVCRRHVGMLREALGKGRVVWLRIAGRRAIVGAPRGVRRRWGPVVVGIVIRVGQRFLVICRDMSDVFKPTRPGAAALMRVSRWGCTPSLTSTGIFSIPPYSIPRRSPVTPVTPLISVPRVSIPRPLPAAFSRSRF